MWSSKADIVGRRLAARSLIHEGATPCLAWAVAPTRGVRLARAARCTQLLGGGRELEDHVGVTSGVDAGAPGPRRRVASYCVQVRWPGSSERHSLDLHAHRDRPSRAVALEPPDGGRTSRRSGSGDDGLSSAEPQQRDQPLRAPARGQPREHDAAARRRRARRSSGARRSRPATKSAEMTLSSARTSALKRRSAASSWRASVTST